MKRLGWEQVPDKLDDTYQRAKLQWVQTQKKINWNTFREGLCVHGNLMTALLLFLCIQENIWSIMFQTVAYLQTSWICCAACKLTKDHKQLPKSKRHTFFRSKSTCHSRTSSTIDLIERHTFQKSNVNNKNFDRFVEILKWYFRKCLIAGELWICKPISMNQGKGIYLVRDPEVLRQKIELLDDGSGTKFGIKKAVHRIIQRYNFNVE